MHLAEYAKPQKEKHFSPERRMLAEPFFYKCLQLTAIVHW